MHLCIKCHAPMEDSESICPTCGVQYYHRSETVRGVSDCPVILLRYALLEDAGGVYFGAVFGNSGDKAIVNCSIKVQFLSSHGDVLSETACEYQDLETQKGETFGEDKLFKLASAGTKKVQVCPKKIMLSDGTILQYASQVFHSANAYATLQETIDKRTEREVIARQMEQEASKIWRRLQNCVNPVKFEKTEWILARIKELQSQGISRADASKRAGEEASEKFAEATAIAKRERDALVAEHPDIWIPSSVTSIVYEDTLRGCATVRSIYLPPTVQLESFSYFFFRGINDFEEGAANALEFLCLPAHFQNDEMAEEIRWNFPAAQVAWSDSPDPFLSFLQKRKTNH